jgi:AraC family transcriptional regulator
MTSEYTARLNRVLNYIDRNICSELDLESIAAEAAFSKYHFHRIFSSAMGESLSKYIQRLRLEKAASSIISNTNKPITEIALEYRFSGSAVFSRVFRNKFGMSPTEWRNGGNCEYSKKEKLQSNRYQPLSKNSKEVTVKADYTELNKNQWRIFMKSEKTNLEYTVKVQQVDEKHLAYIRHTGPYAGDVEVFEKLFTKVMKWAGARSLFIPGKTEMLTIYHDSPEVTEEDKLRISVCMTVPEGTDTSGEIGYMDLPAGRYAVAEFRINMEQYGDAWNTVFGDWLPESGYQCSDGSCYELYLNDPSKDPEGKHHIKIHIPVKAL